jgi:hypothetical protein
VIVVSVLLAAALTTAATAARAVPAGNKPQKPPRAAVQVVRAAYDVFQNDEVKGHENIVRTNYSDNTIAFDVEYVLSPAEAITARQNVELLLREDSYFPLRFHEEKNIDQQGSQMQISIDVEMLSNVAVFTSSTSGKSGSRNIVVPTGAAFVETGVVYIYYPFLFWYDNDRGGRQNFDVLDVTGGRIKAVVMEHLSRQTVTVGGQEYEADLYLVERDRYNVNLFVDDDGRILRVEQNFMRWDLTSWSLEGGESGGTR